MKIISTLLARTLFTTGCLVSAMSDSATSERGSKQLYWGDTHLHTSYSGDAFAVGNETADPDTAYRFAKGLPVIHPYNRARVQLDRPLDFLVVADHTEYMGLLQLIKEDSPLLQQSDIGKKLLEIWKNEGGKAVYYNIAQTVVNNQPYAEMIDEAMVKPVWDRIVDAAERHNEPGKFTTFIGWEWSAMPGGANLHRIVFTDQGGKLARQFLPMSSLGSNRAEDLWAWLDKTAAATGADFVAIPHNANVSKGMMFNQFDSDGRPLNADYGRTRMRWEPVVEVTQIKGDSETHTRLSPEDPFAAFETYEHIMDFGAEGNIEADEQGSYVRSALKRGLEIETATGTNPFKLGMIGSTDSHSGLSAAQEPYFWGKFAMDSIPENKDLQLAPGATGWDMSAAGMAAVWAEDNTRESIFAAFKRKEVYATTGPRIQLRFFGGFDFVATDADARDIAAVGYAKGVSMGGDLTHAPHKQAPSFLIQAVKDPQGGNLDRVQVVKGWLDTNGQSREKVFNVALADGREDRGSNTRPVGNTVDLASGRYTNSIGDAELSVVWTDPEFDPAQRSFYYLRVLQIPTPRHTLYDSIALGIDPESKGHPATIQERAYSSPIWYTP